MTTRTMIRRMAAIVTVLTVILTALAAAPPRLTAQEGPAPAQLGDPPRASLITIDPPNANGVVIIRGEPGAVFPGAVVAIRNMYTGQTVYPRAELTGAFIGEIYGPGNTPFWISPAQRIENAERNVPGSLPGGPGVIVAGPRPERYDPPPLPPVPETQAPATPIVIDGLAAEWPDLASGTPIDLGGGEAAILYGLANVQSLFMALVPPDGDASLPVDYVRLEVLLGLDGRRFLIQLDPRRGGGGQFFEVAPNLTRQARGPLGGFSAQQEIPGGAVEMRFPRTAFTGSASPIAILGVRFVAASCCDEDVPPGAGAPLALPVEERDELDNTALHPLAGMPEDAIAFTLSGPVGGGHGLWQADGRINQVSFQAGDIALVEMQVNMQAPDLPGGGAELLEAGLRLVADLRLEPITVGGVQGAAGRMTGNGWSGLLTPSGLAVENVAGGIPLGDATAQGLVVANGRLTFLLQWAIPIPATIPAGLYTPALTGTAAVNGRYNSWGAPGILGNGPGVGVPEARLPLVLRFGSAPEEAEHLIWSLFQDSPASSGARGVLAREDAGIAALANRVAFNGGTTILPRIDPATGRPIAYPLEPYLPIVLSNSFYQTIAPLIPFAFDSGELTVTVQRPDGTRDDLGVFPLQQNTLSSAARIESEVFSPTSPVDMYRLTTLDPRLMAYTFEQDGHHIITVSGRLTDVWGNRYEGGGTYDVWLAEPLYMLPGVLPGTPFEVGDVFAPTLTISPSLPADVTVRMQVFPLEGDAPVVYEVSGTANAYGYFYPGADAADWVLTTPGEYVVDITASYTDSLGRLWMGSVRGAGVIGSPTGDLVARGGRGIAGVRFEDHLAWYPLDRVSPHLQIVEPDIALRWPYHSGDTLWLRDRTGRLAAGQRLTDRQGAYQDWLVTHLPGWAANDGSTMRELANVDELPVLTVGPAAPEAAANQAYAYLNAVRPGLTARQMVLGDETPSLVLSSWGTDDPYNGQRGIGVNGDLPGDYTFLFGGVVVRNAALDLRQTAIYGAVAMVTSPNDPRGDRVYPPLRGAADGADGGPLLTVDGQGIEIFFVPTGVQPGQVLTVGAPLILAGQVAPTLPALVRAEITSPDGRVLPLGGRANAVGYYYDPEQTLILDRAGIWRVRLQVTYDGLTSAGLVREPYPTGGALGTRGGEFALYVVPARASMIELQRPAAADTFLPVALPFNVTVVVPDDWQSVQLDYTVQMNGMVMDSGVQPAYSGIFAYNYDPRRLNWTFSNLDVLRQDTQVPYSADTVRMTFVLTGQKQSGRLVMAARMITLFGDRLLALYDGWPEPSS